MLISASSSFGLRRSAFAILAVLLCASAPLREISAAPAPHAIYDASGAFVRVETIDPARLPPIPLARDGQPRAVPVKAAPAHDAARETLSVARDGTLTVVALPPERIEAIASEKAAAATRTAQISAARAVRAKLLAGTALTAAELQAVVRLLALDWLDQHSPEEVREAIGER